MSSTFKALQEVLEGDMAFDKITRNIYATDASVYQQIPQAVCWPKTETDLITILHHCHTNNWNITLRAAGTSLAGQAIGNGIIVDMSRYFTQILSLDADRKKVIVQPGVIRDELNQFLQPHNLFFGPNTSTSNRCNIGGMVGNNSSGTTSIKYGTTRDKVRRISAILSDGSKVEFKDLNADEFQDKCKLKSLEGEIYRHIKKLLDRQEIKETILSEYPKSNISRRNTGYALDALMLMEPFNSNGTNPFNFCQLICGSEGTLAVVTEVELDLSSLPPVHGALLCVHFNDLKKTMEAVPEIMQFNPDALEMMDRTILQCTIGHHKYEKYREFVVDDPFALLMIEFRANSRFQLDTIIKDCQSHLKDKSLGYAFPVLYGDDIKNAWQLRKAGLGLLGNLPGDKKAVACIEDTAVAIDDLKDFILEFDAQMRSYNQNPVYYAHAGAGELHIRPILNLKDPEEVKDFRSISLSTAQLVKKYGGSLSGEHGDGRVRGEFIPIVLGQEVYEMFKSLKNIWDPKNILNPGKIVNCPPMDEELRTSPGNTLDDIDTVFDFSDEMGIHRAVEKCNGSGDCRKTEKSSGVMCPSYMATKDEKMTTRARANMLRIVLNSSISGSAAFKNEELKSILDHCLSCKGCLSECPSKIDMAKLKAEVNYQYFKYRRHPFKDYFFGFANRLFKLSSKMSSIVNLISSLPITSNLIKRILHIHPKRNLPNFERNSFKLKDGIYPSLKKKTIKQVYLFGDEFTRYHEPQIVRKSIEILNYFGYEVKIAPIEDSARSQISKGFLDQAKYQVQYNIDKLKPLISKSTPLIGIEPSSILGFRDEYPQILNDEENDIAVEIGQHCYTFDEFLLYELQAEKISISDIHNESTHIKIHTHCHQKALSENDISEQLLAFFPHLHIEKISSGCCGMAGSFGYDKNNYQLSMDIGELVLFPAIRSSSSDTKICANGTSCRHQIKDGTNRDAQHIIELIYDLLILQK